MPRRVPELVVDLLLVVVAAVWGASFLAAKELVSETGVASGVALRFLVAAIALVFPVGLGGLILWFTNDWGGWSVLVATILACVVVVAELWPVLLWLGGVFEKIDVSEVSTST